MTPARRRGPVRSAEPRSAERGAALLVAVGITAALSVVVGAVGLFALVDLRVASASRDQAQAGAAADAALEVALAALATETDLDAVRSGLATAAASGASTLATSGGDVDVDGLTRALARARGRLAPPWGGGTWRPYLWGRLGELVAVRGAGADDPLVVVWVRGDVPPDVTPDRVELAVEAVTPGGARAAATALAVRRHVALGLEAVWPDAGLID